jgi:hypothetical protein
MQLSPHALPLEQTLQHAWTGTTGRLMGGAADSGVAGRPTDATGTAHAATALAANTKPRTAASRLIRSTRQPS